MKIYLAGPFFYNDERPNILKACSILRERGFDVFLPLEHKVENGETMPNDEWGKAVFDLDMVGLNNCDVFVVLYYGMYSDSGTAWECGYASCLHKPVVVVHCQDKQESSLMVINGSCANLKSIDDLKNYDFDKLNSTNFCGFKPQK